MKPANIPEHPFVPVISFAHRTVKGLHVNFAPPSKPGLSMVLSIMLGRHFPKLFGFSDFDIQRLFPCMEKLVVESIKETGYLHIQATKPDTVGKNMEMVSSCITWVEIPQDILWALSYSCLSVP